MNIDRIKQHMPGAPAALLFTALLAQAPHAAAVFTRVAPHGAQWELWASGVGALVYAIALESATAYFVWRNQRRWAIAFAAFSIAHNVAYYMPAEWSLYAWGATLLWRNVVGSVLISVSLPIAIAAFSHVQSQQAHEAQQVHAVAHVNAPAVHHVAPVPAPVPVHVAPTVHTTTLDSVQDSVQNSVQNSVPQPDKRTRATQLHAEGYTASEIARMLDANRNTVQSWLKRATVNGSVQP